MTDLEVLRQAAGLTWGKWGLWLYDTWAEHNRQHFGGQLGPIAMDYGLTPHARFLGYFHHGEADRLPRMMIHQSLLDPRGDAWHMGLLLGARLASDVVLHEMIHQYIHQLNGHNGAAGKAGWTSHMNPLWVAEVNRLSEALGYPALAEMPTRKRAGARVSWAIPEGKLTRKELSAWPYSVTCPAYYAGGAAREFRRGGEA